MENDTQFGNGILIIDRIKKEFWLSTKDDKDFLLQGKIGKANFHYATPRGADFTGFFNGELVIEAKLPFSDAVYLNLNNLQTINQNEKDNQMKTTEEVDTQVKEAEEAKQLETEDKHASTQKKDKDEKAIFIYEFGGKTYELYYYHPVKHKAFSNPKKILNEHLSRQNRRRWTRERDVYLGQMAQSQGNGTNVDDKNNEQNATNETKVTIPTAANESKPAETKLQSTATAITELNGIDKLAAKSAKQVRGALSEAARTHIISRLGEDPRKQIYDIGKFKDVVENGAFIGCKDAQQRMQILRFDIADRPSEIVFLIFNKMKSADHWLTKMRENARLERELQGLNSWAVSAANNSFGEYDAIIVRDVEAFLARLYPKKVQLSRQDNKDEK